MRFAKDQLVLSATDVANHLGCHHLTALDLRAAAGELSPPVWEDPALEGLQRRGFLHEEAYVAHLVAQGRDVVRLEADDRETGVERTATAMREGVDVIVQASLGEGQWYGRADLLVRVEVPSELGPWSYEVVDTKLARETRGGTVLQLCLYSELLAEVQGRLSESMHVVAPGRDFVPETFRTADYFAYYRLIQRRLVGAVATPEETYPDPVARCDQCRWWSDCRRRWVADDHLSLVAGSSRLHRRELGAHDVNTLAGLARLPAPVPFRPRRGAAETYTNLREQARVQLEGRERERPVWERLPVGVDRGLALLPEPCPADLFFDLEGDPFWGEGGLEYLFGYAYLDDDGALRYESAWAHDAVEERRAFEHFVDFVMARWAAEPAMHVYHFAPYEPSALKRMMGRQATREDAVDRMLRGGLLVDLHKVVRQGVRASVERYSLKDLEPFHGFARAVELPEASRNLHAMELALEFGDAESVTEEMRAAVLGYNRDDCFSTHALREWLEAERSVWLASGVEVLRPAPREAAPPDALAERRQRVEALVAALLAPLPEDPAAWSEAERSRSILAHLLDYHRRESKATWWELFRLRALEDDDLLEERNAVAGLVFEGEGAGRRGNSMVHRYRFPPQDTRIGPEDPLQDTEGRSIGVVDAIDGAGHRLDIRKSKAGADLHPSALLSHVVIGAEPIEDALLRIGEQVRDRGIEAAGPHAAGRNLLMRVPPKALAGAAVVTGAAVVKLARSLTDRLAGDVLPIQGPPGTGKTYTAARMVVDLARAGKRAGLTGPSHKVIRNLLDEVVRAAAESGPPLTCMQKVGRKSAEPVDAIREVTSNAPIEKALADGVVQVVAGTAWLWSRGALADSVDVLFVDEAGQMSLAAALGASQCANSLVLIGDPRQLDQPIQGSHPDGIDVSVLDQLLGDDKTIRPGRGLFLGETWRLHPAICEFTSELFYEGRLTTRPGLERQRLAGNTPFVGAGLRYCPVAHDGNQTSSPEEAEVVTRLFDALTGGDVSWIGADGDERPLCVEDVLIIAPYNDQVAEIAGRLPAGARVGTVDKFQGQEGAVVIFSMATSNPEDAPHGMEFLFSASRLNVATSRARCVCVLVASPRLFEVDCQTPRQMQLANAFCRYLEVAGEHEVLDDS